MIQLTVDEMAMFKRVLLNNYEGRTVFGMILEQLGTFNMEPPKGIEDATLRAFGMQLIGGMGVTHLENYELLLEGLNELPIRGVSTNHEED